MDNELEVLLVEYSEYSEMFAKQIFDRKLWEEQTGCEVGEFFDYIGCCQNRLYDFGTWFEHTRNVEYPVGDGWNDYRTFKQTLLNYHT